MEKNKSDILLNERDFSKVIFQEEKVSSRKPWRERKLKAIIDDLREGDRLILLEPSCLDRLRDLVPGDGLNIPIKEKFFLLRQFVNSSLPFSASMSNDPW